FYERQWWRRVCFILLDEGLTGCTPRKEVHCERDKPPSPLPWKTAMEKSAWFTLDRETDRNELRSARQPTDTAGMALLTPGSLEEDLIEDARASLTPAQMVERKLVSLLKSNPLPISQMMTGQRSLRAR